MSPNAITQLILEYRYWILIPLSFVEGPIVAFAAGTLAAVGLFNMYFLAALFFIRDVGLDAVYYAIGYFGGRTSFAERMLAKIGITEDHLGQLRVLWVRRPAITLFIGKLSYGIASAFIVVAGMIKMPLKIFFKYGIFVAIVEYGFFLLAGYYLGAAFGGTAEAVIRNVQYVVAGATLLISAYLFISWKMRSRFLKEDEEIEHTLL